MTTKQQGHPITSARRMGAKQTNPLPLQDDHDEGYAAANLASRHDLAMHVEAQTPGFASCGKVSLVATTVIPSSLAMLSASAAVYSTSNLKGGKQSAK